MPDQGVPLDPLKGLLSGVDPEQLRQAMPLGVITMIFTDIVDSTRVKHDVGDLTYFAALNRHNSVVRESIARHAGHELKTIGDSFLIAFTDPGKAVQCAAQIQQTFAETPIITGDGSINVRIGIHTGTPIVYRDDVSGRTDLSGTDVDKAARIESIARGGQVLISEQTRVLIDRMAVHDWGLWELKGLGGQRIWEVLYPGKHPEIPAGRMRLKPLRFATSFIGREREVAELTNTLKHYRLVTVTGIGGIGKTRLADFAVRRVSDTHADGVFFVELAGTADSESAVVSALVAALVVNPAGFKDEAEALLRSLQNRQTLIVLDNFEGVASAIPLVGKLFLECPHAHFLVTSQVPLNLDGEQLYQAPAMDIPVGTADANSLAGLDAVALFRERARARVHDWDLRSPAEITAVAEILRLVDGIPLAIELAAAWVGSKTLPEIRTGLGNQLDLLRRRGIGAISRHQSMQACLDYSFGLLSDDAREVLPNLSIFTGGFFAEDVEAGCDASGAGELLVFLHERSLLARQEVLGRSRYSMLATVQEYAANKLPKIVAAQLKRVHARYFLRVLRIAAQQLHETGYAAALERIDIDIANFEAGIRESQRSEDHYAVCGYATHLADYLRIKGRHNDRLTLALAARAAAENFDAEVVARADNNLGTAYAHLPTGNRGDNLRHAITCYEAALRVQTEHDFPQDWATTQDNLGNTYAHLPTGNRDDNLRHAIVCYKAALRVQTERDFPQDWAGTENNLGKAYAQLPTGDRGDNLRHAIECFEAALRVRTERDFPQYWATTQSNLGVAYADLPTGDLGDNSRHAIECCKAALRVWTERDFPQDWAGTENNLGKAYVQLPTGDRGDNLWHAIECFEAALREWTECDFPQYWAGTQNNLGVAYANLPTGDRGDNLRHAIECYQAALRVWTERDFPQYWAGSQNNLGVAYADLPTGDRGDNLRHTIECCKAALRVWTERDFPQYWAETQNNLGAAYAAYAVLRTGDRGDNLRHAIECFQAAARSYDAAGLTNKAGRARTMATVARTMATVASAIRSYSSFFAWIRHKLHL
jgi:predicted ATPase/class 3 adenylate cyclase